MKTELDPLGWKGFYERFAAPLLSRDRFFIGMMFALAVAAAEAVALAALVPLHREVPYVIGVNTKGQVRGLAPIASSGTPTGAELVYWVSRWVSDLYKTDPAYSGMDLKEAFLFTQDAATAQMNQFLAPGAKNPITLLAKNPSIRITVAIHDVRRIGAKELYVVADLTDTLTGASEEKDVTLNYQLTPPKTVKDAIRNPIGLHITNFTTGNSG